MSGHSKWSQIKRKKAVNDTRRGKMITKHLRAIQAAARVGGTADPAANVNLRNLVEAAKRDNVPADNIERALAKVSGEGEGAVQYESVVYEGYAPGGIALLIEGLTDNRNRMASAIRHVLSKYGGSLGASGSVAWQFERRGILIFETDDERLQEVAIELGALDLLPSGDGILEVYCEANDTDTLEQSLRTQGFTALTTEITMLSQHSTALEQGDAHKVIRLVDALDELDDVQHVYTNLDLSNVDIET